MRLPAKQRRSRFDSGPIVHFASVVQRMGVRLLSGTMSVRVRPGAPSSSDGEGERYFGPKETLADRSSDTTAWLNGRATRILVGRPTVRICRWAPSWRVNRSGRRLRLLNEWCRKAWESCSRLSANAGLAYWGARLASNQEVGVRSS